ncbi:MAG: hypothetical protein PVJ67_07230 [Candidatus Pacearchaeota archaeon]|jgi:hypothetical protein
MIKINLTNFEKKVILAEAVFVFISLFYIFFSSAPNQIYPLNGMTIREANFNIEIKNGEEVLISTDKEFTNPIILRENDEIELPQGIYYWKVKGKLRESEIKSFTIESHVGLEIKKRAENYELENSGNVNLNVTKNKAGITSSTSLSAGEIKKIKKDNSTYEGGEI